MNTIYQEAPKINNVDFQKRNTELQQLYSQNRKDFQKRNDLRKNRLQYLNEYRDEQVAALKH